MEAKLKKFIWVDLQRAFGNWRVLFGILGVSIVFLYNNYKFGSVIEWASHINSISALCMAAFIFASYPYGTAFCEDREYRYDMQLILRGNSISYVCSKMIAVFLVSFFTMLTGFLLSCFFISLECSLVYQTDIDELSRAMGHYYQLVLKGDYILYLLCVGVQFGCLAGTLSIIGLMCSLFIRSRMMVYILPVAMLYVEDILAQRLLGWEDGSVFSLRAMGIASIQYTVQGQSWQLFYFEIFMILLCCGSIICWKTGRR